MSLVGVYPQYRAVRWYHVFHNIDTMIHESLKKSIRRVVLTACGYLQGDWVETMEESRVVTLLEPVTEGVMQLFCQVGVVYQRKNN